MKDALADQTHTRVATVISLHINERQALPVYTIAN